MATLTSSISKENFFVNIPLSFFDWLSCDLEIGFVTPAKLHWVFFLLSVTKPIQKIPPIDCNTVRP